MIGFFLSAPFLPASRPSGMLASPCPDPVVGKAADAAALAAASRIKVVLYRETGAIEFLPEVYGTVQSCASMNSAFLRSRQIGVAVMGISVDDGSQVVSVSAAADVSSLIPGTLPFQGFYQVARTAEARIEGR